MNDYGFDYMNYLTNVPNSMNYNKDSNQITNYNSMMGVKANYNPMDKAKMKMMNQQQIIDPYQGLIRGNLFGNLYDPYKNYKPTELNPTTEKEALLYQILQYKFALTDLNLYLDLYPDDQRALSLYQEYLGIEKQMCKKYENMYGPMTLDSQDVGTNTWAWKNSPWPWEGV